MGPQIFAPKSIPPDRAFIRTSLPAPASKNLVEAGVVAGERARKALAVAFVGYQARNVSEGVFHHIIPDRPQGENDWT